MQEQSIYNKDQLRIWSVVREELAISDALGVVVIWEIKTVVCEHARKGLGTDGTPPDSEESN
ncbi:hypothetical protein STEG23_019017, partial [Scotinomys teguina]